MQRMKRRNIILVLIACFSALQGIAQDSTTRVPNETFTLQQCVDIAVKNNNTVKLSLFTMENDKVAVQGALGNILPYVSGSVAHNEYYGRSINPNTNQFVNTQNLAATYSFGASITLWNASALRKYLEQTNDYYKAGTMDVQQNKDLITITIILDYLQVLSDLEQLNITLSSLAATREQVRVNDAKNESGAIAPSDYFLLKGQLGTNEVAASSAKGALEAAKVQLCQDMNVNYSSTMTLAPIGDTNILAPYGSNVDEIYGYSLHNLALVKAADYRLEGARAQVKSARGQLFPSLSLNAGVGTNYSSYNQTNNFVDSVLTNTGQFINPGAAQNPVYYYKYNYSGQNIQYFNQLKGDVNYYVGLQLNIPILESFQYRNRLRQAKIQRDQYDFTRTTTHIQLRQAIEKDYVNMSIGFDNYKSTVREVDAYNQAFKAAQAQLDAGSINTYTYVIAKNNIDGANLSLVAAKYNYILQTKILDYYLGRLTY
jgi:outer membrane protein